MKSIFLFESVEFFNGLQLYIVQFLSHTILNVFIRLVSSIFRASTFIS